VQSNAKRFGRANEDVHNTVAVDMASAIPCRRIAVVRGHHCSNRRWRLNDNQSAKERSPLKVASSIEGTNNFGNACDADGASKNPAQSGWKIDVFRRQIGCHRPKPTRSKCMSWTILVSSRGRREHRLQYATEHQSSNNIHVVTRNAFPSAAARLTEGYEQWRPARFLCVCGTQA